MAETPQLRCAIYTRKSSEEGLEQAFNSLHAQREACEAYVKSQRHEGWLLLKNAYDDGGYSGGSMVRPGLATLLADIEAGNIDVVVVYKVDRLTRSLTDFARIVERFEAHQVSFVSVTQAFNTTSSMGRLTLNVLLSFAQFEREVTGERIRDKIAASRQKGMWMGGFPPLGYDVQSRKLQVNSTEAEQVLGIYQRYLELGSVTTLAACLDAEGVRSKRWTTLAGHVRGGVTMGRGMLYALLSNRVYLGEAIHKGKIYPGEHDAIVPQALWESVQARLAQNRRGQSRIRMTTPSFLAGLLFDDRGHPMTPVHSTKGKNRRYRYYTSRALIRGTAALAGSLPRVPAADLEEVVLQQLKIRLAEGNVSRALPTADTAETRTLVRRHLKRITLSATRVSVEFFDLESPATPNPAQHSNGKGHASSTTTIVEIPVRLNTRGGGKNIVTPSDRAPGSTPHLDTALVKALGRGWAWRRALERGTAPSISALARDAGCSNDYVIRILRLAYLAPDIIEAVLAGRQPRELTLTALCKRPFPHAWTEQRQILGFSN